MSSDKKDEMSPKDAVKAAIRFREEVTEKKFDGTLEEIELEGGFWHITLGFEISSAGDIFDVLSGTRRRPKDYYVFKVDALSGKIYSMKLRE